MTWVVAIIGLILTVAWIEQIITQRARKRKGPVKVWWKDPDDGNGPDGDY